jgi:hypothetical protein
MGKDGRFEVAVTFDERRGHVGTHPELRVPVTALSLGGLRRKVEAAMFPRTSSSCSTSTRSPGWSATAGGSAVGRARPLQREIVPYVVRL